MSKINVGELNLNLMRMFMQKKYPNKKYKIYDYGTFYSAVIEDGKDATIQPIIFDGKNAFPLMKTYSSMIRDIKNDPKLIYDGGKGNGKK